MENDTFYVVLEMKDGDNIFVSATDTFERAFEIYQYWKEIDAAEEKPRKYQIKKCICYPNNKTEYSTVYVDK